MGPFRVQEDRVDLQAVHVESHLMESDRDVSMMQSVESHGLMTMEVPLEEPPPPPPLPPPE